MAGIGGCISTSLVLLPTPLLEFPANMAALPKIGGEPAEDPIGWPTEEMF